MVAALRAHEGGPCCAKRHRDLAGSQHAVRGATARARRLDWAGPNRWGARYLKGTRSLETTSNQPIHDTLKPVLWQ